MRFICFCILALIGTPLLAQDKRPASEQRCSDLAVCPIAYVRLSTQETDPFLKQGKIVDEEHADWEGYRGPIRKFSDVRSCLTEDQRYAQFPDLRKVNWPRLLGQRNEAEVCVFRIVTSLLSVDAIETWALSLDMNVSELGRTKSEDYQSKYPMEPRFNLGLGWTGDQYRERVAWSPLGLLNKFIYGYSITVTFSENMQVSGASVSSNSI
jgi:hypothetical protein